MQKKHLESLLYSTGGVAALVVILIAANFIISAFNIRADLTQGSVYTLSPGTKAILSKLEAPVKIRFYFSQGSTVPVGLKTFAKRVEDLLSEFKHAGGGKVIIEKLNPEPDSDAEDSAVLDGVEGQLTNTQEKFYFGLAVNFLDQKSALPVLAPDREQLLEYDITRAISRVASAAKPVVGVMSALPVMGQPLNPMKKQQPSEPWTLITELQNIFTVKKVERNVDKIPDDIKVLLVIHPRDLSEVTEYALDQFVLRGGKMIAFLDSYAYFDQQPDLTNPFGTNNAGQSTFNFLLKHWGFAMEMSKVVADLTYASGTGARLLPGLLALPQAALNKDDVVTSQVGNLLVPFGSAFTGKPTEGLTQTVLVQSSPNAMFVDLIIATLSGEPSTRGFQPAGTPYTLAMRLSGKFKTAFPEGKPKPYESSRDPKKAEEARADEPKGEPQLKESAQENSIVLVSDVDMLSDGAAVEVQEVFGQRLVVPKNGNLNFAQSLIEQVSGDYDLTKLRSRAAFSRPLTVVQQMESRAQQSYLGKIKELEDNLQQTQEKLTKMQKARGTQASVISAEQQAEIDNFKTKSIETRKELKDLRRNLREESETMQFWTKLVNIGLVPFLVVLLGIVLAMSRRNKQRAAAK